jgi:O-antigen/teichoic acid export membrane protein
MLKILKSSVRDTIIYSIGTFSTKLGGLILVRLYTNKHFLSTEEFGVLNLVEVNLQVMISVLGLGLCYAFERWYWDKEYFNRRKPIFFTVMVVSAILTAFILGGLFPFATFFSEALFDKSDYEYIFKLMILNAGLEIIAQTPNSLIRLQEKPLLFTIANITKLTINVIFTVIFIVKMDLGLPGVYYGQLLGVAAYFIVVASFILKNIEIKFEWRTVFEMIWFRFPFLLPIIALNLFNYSDKFLLSKLAGVTEVGIYSLGAKLSNTIKTFLLTAIFLSLTPTIYRMMNDPGHKRFYSKVMTYLSFTVIMVVMAFSFFSKELVMVFAKDKVYYAAYTVVPVISLAVFFGMLKDVSLIGLNISKKTRPIATVTILAALVNIGLNFLFIPTMGMMGAAFALLLSQVAFFILVYWIAQKQYSIPYEIGKIGLMLAVAVALFFVARITDGFGYLISVPLRVLILLSYPFILFLFGFYEPVELERLAGFWNKWKNPRAWLKNISELQA